MGIEKMIRDAIADQVHEALAEKVAERAREQGYSRADSVQIDEESETGGVEIDPERVRARANEMLSNG